jgi:NAD(P)-dependent dehydrogenase (short-subunit alcohol dehydrogenase family)
MSAPTAVVIGVGADRGLGAALCRRFAREGYHVLFAGRTREKIEQVARTIAGAGGSAEAVTTDAAREEDVVRLLDRALSPGGGREPADLVIFNAGNNQRSIFANSPRRCSRISGASEVGPIHAVGAGKDGGERAQHRDEPGRRRRPCRHDATQPTNVALRELRKGQGPLLKDVQG